MTNKAPVQRRGAQRTVRCNRLLGDFRDPDMGWFITLIQCQEHKGMSQATVSQQVKQTP